MTAISRRYGVNTDALYRHRRHIPPALKAKLLQGPDTDIDIDKLRETESQSLLAHLIALRRRLFASFDYAEEHGDTHMLTRVSAQLHHNLEITARLVGSLSTGAMTVNNILVAPQYVEMRVELVRALAPFPEAKRVVAGVLHQIETTAVAATSGNPRELAQ